MERALIIETTDVLFDWVTYVLAVYAGDLQFGNDPNNILRNIILVLCIFSTVACVVEVILYKHSKEHFRRIYLGSTCLTFSLRTVRRLCSTESWLQPPRRAAAMR